MNHCKRPENSRAGFTLIELSVSSVAAAILILGLASSLFLATETLNVSESSQAVRSDYSRVMDQMLQDIRHALAFSERTSTALTFTVPDRDGDKAPEKIRYWWSGSPGDALIYEYNDHAAQKVIVNVNHIDFTYTTRLMVAQDVESSTGTVVFEEFTEAKLPSNGTSLDINVPAGATEGDLLIAAVAHDGKLDAMSLAGWNEITIATHNNSVCFGVWWKIASAFEPPSYNCAWVENEEAYGWMMRFTGHDLDQPIHDMAVQIGASPDPISPAVTTSMDNAMILRLGGFDDDDITIDDTGLSGHTTITMDGSRSSGSSASGGAGYGFLPTAGYSDTNSFSLSYNEDYVTVTLAIAPE